MASCFLLINCDPLAIPYTIKTSTNLTANLGSVVKILDHPGCWTVTLAKNCGGAVSISVTSVSANCETCNLKPVMFTSCCGFTAYFTLDIAVTPYLAEGNVYIYNGAPLADGLGNTLYPNICYAYSEITTALPLIAAPTYANFSASQGLTCNVPACQNCFYKLINCDDLSQIIYTYSNLSAVVGQVITIDGYPNICWTVEASNIVINPAAVVTVNSYDTCLDCKGYYFTLNDCCTDAPYLNSIGQTLVLHYTGESVDGITPASLTDLIISSISNESSPDAITGCFKLTEIDITTFTSRPEIVRWEIVVQEVSTLPTCENCQVCKICYLLTDCVTGETKYITGTDLSQYLGGVVTIKGCENQCWIVTQSETCEGCDGPVTVLSYFPATEPAPGQICKYLFDFNFAGYSIASADIVIDSVLYPLVCTNFFTLIDAITALNLGTAYFGNGGAIPMLGITGDHVYGPICLYLTLGETIVPKVCFTPTCTTYLNNCSYDFLPVVDNVIPSVFVSITINGTVYTTSLIPSPTINKLLIWLNSLGLGFFTGSLNSPANTEFGLQVFGNANYGNVVVGNNQAEQITLSAKCQTEPTNPPCDLCLPQPLPEPPVVLNTRFVKPGYTTPFCSPEYTEKVNCNYGDQLYNRMLSARYGLTVCCDEAFDKWLIKKELLDLDSIRNTEFVCCTTPASCNTCNLQNCNCPPEPVVPTCVCYSAELNCSLSRFCDLTYTDCNSVVQTIIIPGGATEVRYICSTTVPTFTGISTILPAPLDCTIGNCKAPE